MAMTNKQIIKSLMKECGAKSKVDLAKKLGVTRQSVFQFEAQEKNDINNRIFTLYVEASKKSKH